MNIKDFTKNLTDVKLSVFNNCAILWCIDFLIYTFNLSVLSQQLKHPVVPSWTIYTKKTIPVGNSWCNVGECGRQKPVWLHTSGCRDLEKTSAVFSSFTHSRSEHRWGLTGSLLMSLIPLASGILLRPISHHQSNWVCVAAGIIPYSPHWRLQKP